MMPHMAVGGRRPYLGRVRGDGKRLEWRGLPHDDARLHDTEVVLEDQAVTPPAEDLAECATGPRGFGAPLCRVATRAAGHGHGPDGVVVRVEDMETAAHANVPNSHCAICRAADADLTVFAQHEGPNVLSMAAQAPEPHAAPWIPASHHGRCCPTDEEGRVSHACQGPNGGAARSCRSFLTPTTLAISWGGGGRSQQLRDVLPRARELTHSAALRSSRWCSCTTSRALS
mmetsp:Transcript_50353/g.114440  ORF Transcript_50353/g.114440 Transcript_50353/m.114440 type:complete len:229 (-) Transcript_50353:254-940(-)